MSKRASIIQFCQEKQRRDNELEDLLDKIDNPEDEFPEFLFENLDNLDPVYFLDDDDDDYIIFLGDNDLIIDGRDDAIDFIASSRKTELSAFLANGDRTNPEIFAKDRKIPLVRDVEVLLVGNIGISRKSDLPKLGIYTETNSLFLDARWEMLSAKAVKRSYATETWIWREKDIMLETTLQVRRAGKEKVNFLFTSNTEGSEK